MTYKDKTILDNEGSDTSAMETMALDEKELQQQLCKATL